MLVQTERNQALFELLRCRRVSQIVKSRLGDLKMENSFFSFLRELVCLTSICKGIKIFQYNQILTLFIKVFLLKELKNLTYSLTHLGH